MDKSSLGMIVNDGKVAWQVLIEKCDGVEALETYNASQTDVRHYARPQWKRMKISKKIAKQTETI